MKSLDLDKSLRLISILVVAFAVLLAIPSFTIWLGLPPEGDAVDYRIPLVKWMATYKSIPNWQWTIVDDYPSLGEICLAFLYWIHPNLMRLLPLLSYLGLGFFSAKIATDFFTIPKTSSKATAFWLAWAWILGLRPMLIQSNLLMMDNLSAMFIVGSLFYILKNKVFYAAVFCALALSSRYSAWPVAIALSAALFFQQLQIKNKLFLKNLFIYFFISSLGAVPFILRNYSLNNNPFYPLFDNYFNGTQPDIAYYIYGRGRDVISFILLPYDFLYTNTYVQAYFDYTLGKLFYLQLFVFCAFLLYKRELFIKNFFKKHRVLIIFFFIHLLLWFAGSQQMRFFIPGLILLNLALFSYIYNKAPLLIVGLLTLATTFSVASVQKDSILMALGKKQSIFTNEYLMAKKCINQATKSAVIGFDRRGTGLGFFDELNFRFVGAHPYIAPTGYNPNSEVDLIYSEKEYPGYSKWAQAPDCFQVRDNL